ncbi:unnamed protein product [Ilex paraguariensis]|uniref:Uncharacterized protein n=1 Tax=Ilex paraguariensis TaxID=185542 RepID=A0ABC8RBM9_9AQUA
MDDEMITLHNVMPVEIAMKRELEYRRKMEALRKQRQSCTTKPLEPLEVSNSNHVTFIGILLLVFIVHKTILICFLLTYQVHL